jgi:hypothetical protein
MPTQALRKPKDSPAMAGAIRAIEQAFGPRAVIQDLKRTVRRVLRNPAHEAIPYRYGARAKMATGTLEQACAMVEHWYREEQRATRFAWQLGYGTRLSMTVLIELRLILRFMRRKKMGMTFAIVAAEIRRRVA